MSIINAPDTLNWMMHPATGVAMSADAWRKGLENTGIQAVTLSLERG